MREQEIIDYLGKQAVEIEARERQKRLGILDNKDRAKEYDDQFKDYLDRMYSAQNKKESK